MILRATGCSRRRNAAAQAASNYIRNRDRVDWSTLPEWARPSDPDLFEGCVHKGRSRGQKAASSEKRHNPWNLTGGDLW
jgi:hypothetical protein